MEQPVLDFNTETVRLSKSMIDAKPKVLLTRIYQSFQQRKQRSIEQIPRFTRALLTTGIET